MKIIGSYKNGNYFTIMYDDGTKQRFTNSDKFVPKFAENMDIKITNMCNMNCPFCHEGSTCNGSHGDIHHKLFDTLHPYQEVALGGGNVFEHPEFETLLYNLKHKKVFANTTLNQIHFCENISTVDKWVKEKLIYGIGVSLNHPSDDFITKVQKYPNAVIHVINGVFTEKDYLALKDKNLKILILGYKHLRRGIDYEENEYKKLKENQKWLYDILPELTNHFKTVSFDNLAIEQLNVHRLMSNEEWERFYMGDDGSSTFYIDLVNNQFARSSTASFDKRYKLMDNVDDMFNVIQNETK